MHLSYRYQTFNNEVVTTLERVTWEQGPVLSTTIKICSLNSIERCHPH